MPNETSDLRRLTADCVSAFTAKNSVDVSDLSSSISNVYASLSGQGSRPDPETPKQKPAVAISSLVMPDYIICLKYGRKLKVLKRYLMASYGLAAHKYRVKWGLPPNYPMVAPKYTQPDAR